MINRPFLVGSELLPDVERSELGNPLSALRVSLAYLNGKNAPKDYDRTLYYYHQILAYYPKSIPWIEGNDKVLCYASLHSSIASIYEIKGDYLLALKHLKKCIEISNDSYTVSKSNSFFERHCIYERIAETKTLLWQKRIVAIKTWFEDLYIKLFWKSYKRKMEQMGD